MDLHSKYNRWARLELCDLQGRDSERRFKACSEMLEFFFYSVGIKTEGGDEAEICIWAYKTEYKLVR